MGRPINKRFFGVNAKNNIKVHFNDGTGKVGYIVKQNSSNKFLCEDESGNTALCILVEKAQSALSAGEMCIAVKLDNGSVKHVTKITSRKITVDGTSYPWNFSTSTSDGAVQMEEAGTDPADLTSTSTNATSFVGA